MSRKIKHGFRTAELSDSDLLLIEESLADKEQALRYKAGLQIPGPERLQLMARAQRATRLIEKIRIDLPEN